MFHEVPVSTELANSEPSRQGRHRSGFLPTSDHILVNGSTHHLILCVFLFKDTLFSMCHRFINTELTTDNTGNSGLTAAYLTHVSSVRPRAAFSPLQTLDSTSALDVVGLLNSKTIRKRPPSVKHVALGRPRQGHLFEV